MKVNEITEGQIWQGVKQVAKGLGNVAGGIGMGTLRALDKLGGGTGKIGTASQQAAQLRQKQDREEKTLVRRALEELQTTLIINYNLKIKDLEKLDPNQKNTIKTYLQRWANQFFSKDIDPNMLSSMSEEIKKLRAPAYLSTSEIKDYFNQIFYIRQSARELNLPQTATVRQTAGGSTQPAMATSPAGVQIINMPSSTSGPGGSATNLVVRYKNQDFILMDNPDPTQPDIWVNLSGKPLAPAMAKFLTDQVAIATP